MYVDLEEDSWPGYLPFDVGRHVESGRPTRHGHLRCSAPTVRPNWRSSRLPTDHSRRSGCPGAFCFAADAMTRCFCPPIIDPYCSFVVFREPGNETTPDIRRHPRKEPTKTVWKFNFLYCFLLFVTKKLTQNTRMPGFRKISEKYYFVALAKKLFFGELRRQF